MLSLNVMSTVANCVMYVVLGITHFAKRELTYSTLNHYIRGSVFTSDDTTARMATLQV